MFILYNNEKSVVEQKTTKSREDNGLRSGVYVITINDTYYVGESVDVMRRKTAHIGCLRRKEHRNWKLQEAYNIHQEFHHKVLEHCPVEQLGERQTYWIDKYDSFHNGYNLTRQTNELRPETREKQSRVQMGKVISQEQREAIRQQLITIPTDELITAVKKHGSMNKARKALGIGRGLIWWRFRNENIDLCQKETTPVEDMVEAVKRLGTMRAASLELGLDAATIHKRFSLAGIEYKVEGKGRGSKTIILEKHDAIR